MKNPENSKNFLAECSPQSFACLPSPLTKLQQKLLCFQLMTVFYLPQKSLSGGTCNFYKGRKKLSSSCPRDADRVTEPHGKDNRPPPSRSVQGLMRRGRIPVTADGTPHFRNLRRTDRRCLITP